MYCFGRSTRHQYHLVGRTRHVVATEMTDRRIVLRLDQQINAGICESHSIDADDGPVDNSGSNLLVLLLKPACAN